MLRNAITLELETASLQAHKYPFGGEGGGPCGKGTALHICWDKTTDLLQCSDIYFVILVLCVVSWRIALSSTRVYVKLVFSLYILLSPCRRAFRSVTCSQSNSCS